MPRKKRTPESFKAAYRQNYLTYRMAAVRAVNVAVKKRLLPPVHTQLCAVHPEEPAPQAQHYHHLMGYEPEHWLDVVPVCADCHTLIDH